MISDLIFAQIDSKINEIELHQKRASVIIVNDGLFRQAQQETLMRDMSQVSGKVRSPFDLQVYKGVRVISSTVCESVEVF